ncbi:hypothetical protein M6D81_22555 [Paenibacillus sp. J5C_2022]|uniref:hypothetical protein n=1 Tax=Paenibacillus sp. J5C2022 TaxID=2977129 RepID=UPI0021D0D9A5|nr:hypothetical protein [Paenibacillus sp. J5C2022]MCU6711482.1 hypothetical protein [Paenibacillus sp. J5C2022]
MEELIINIKALKDFRTVSYYTAHLRLPLWRIFSGTKWNGIPFFLKSICRHISCLIEESGLSQGEVIQYIANSEDNPSYFFVSQCILLYGTSQNLNELERYNIADRATDLPADITIDVGILSCAVACFVLDGNRYSDWDFRSIVNEERFAYQTNDYKLTKVSNIDFNQDGFVYDGKYYLYNGFIDREPIEFLDKMPAVFNLMINCIDLEAADFYLRLDERLSVPLKEANISHFLQFEKFRGISFRFSDTKLDKLKNITVHYNPETYDKLLMVIKKDYDVIANQEFWHIEVEQLPFIDRTESKGNIKTIFVHGKYYPVRRVFTHVDFTINQYPFEEYSEKQDDHSNKEIQIDYYTTKECHYKVWCVENIDISEELWYKLTSVSLPSTYRRLFDEILEKM